ncbi:MAG TPA: thioredoxin family protein [Actinomycetota bacterium]|nr:thioredoxin family protein [Actinomycetota bacterium]
MATRIRILGPGCVKCQKLYENTKEAVESLGIDAEVVKAEDVNELVIRGVFETPALVVNERVLLTGRVPTVSTLRELLASSART